MITMIGDPPRSNPTIRIPSWDYRQMENQFADGGTGDAHISSSHKLNNVYGSDAFHYENALTALQRYLPANKDDGFKGEDGDYDGVEAPAEEYSCDKFRMFVFKVKKCVRARSHDWTECPFAHPGEKARRRDPRMFHYSGHACPDFRKGACAKGDSCEYAHGVFESWLHPARYRTQPCKDGTHCRRRVCFFAHTSDQLRVLPYAASPECSPTQLWSDPPSLGVHDPFTTFGMLGSSSTSSFFSPPSSPVTTCSPPASFFGTSVNQLADSMRSMWVNKVKTGVGLSTSPPAWHPGIGSPRSSSKIRPGIRNPDFSPGFEAWDVEEELMMERVESGRKLREKIYAKLGKENSLERGGRVNTPGMDPDVDWISDLVR